MPKTRKRRQSGGEFVSKEDSSKIDRFIEEVENALLMPQEEGGNKIQLFTTLLNNLTSNPPYDYISSIQNPEANVNGKRHKKIMTVLVNMKDAYYNVKDDNKKAFQNNLTHKLIKVIENDSEYKTQQAETEGPDVMRKKKLEESITKFRTNRKIKKDNVRSMVKSKAAQKKNDQRIDALKRREQQEQQENDIINNVEGSVIYLDSQTKDPLSDEDKSTIAGIYDDFHESEDKAAAEAAASAADDDAKLNNGFEGQDLNLPLDSDIDGGKKSRKKRRKGTGRKGTGRKGGGSKGAKYGGTKRKRSSKGTGHKRSTKRRRSRRTKKH